MPASMMPVFGLSYKLGVQPPETKKAGTCLRTFPQMPGVDGGEGSGQPCWSDPMRRAVDIDQESRRLTARDAALRPYPESWMTLSTYSNLFQKTELAKSSPPLLAPGHFGALAVYCRSTSTVLSRTLAVTCGVTPQSRLAGSNLLA